MWSTQLLYLNVAAFLPMLKYVELADIEVAVILA